MIKQKTTIYLARHGAVLNPKNIVYGREIDVHLSKEGWKQMRDLAKRLKKKGVKFQAIFVSPLSRCLESAEAVSQVFPGLSIYQDDNLLETDAPAVTGILIEDLEKMKGKEYDLDGMESKNKMAERMKRALKQIRQNYSEKTVLAISHGDPIAFCIASLVNPKNPDLTITSLKSEGFYLAKGEAWRLLFNQNGKLIEHEIIGTNEGRVSKEFGR